MKKLLLLFICLPFIFSCNPLKRMAKQPSQKSESPSNPKLPCETGPRTGLVGVFNDSWELKNPGPASASGITFDSRDNSFWIVDYFEFYVYHYSKSGQPLPGGFSYPDTILAEGITLDTSDGTFWFIDVAYDKIYHFDKSVHLSSFSTGNAGCNSGMGIAYDPTDGTLWVLDYNIDFMYHFDKSGSVLSDGFSVYLACCDDGRGLAYDDRDDTFWFVNGRSKFMAHFNKEGKMLSNSFSFSNIMPSSRRGNFTPDGLALDENHTFWLPTLMANINYHIGHFESVPNNK